MIIQAELKRKQSEYKGEACSVDKVIELPAQRFQQFSRALLADYDFIAENTPLSSSCGFITPRTVEKVPFLRGFSNFLDSIVCPPVPSGSGQKL